VTQGGQKGLRPLSKSGRIFAEWQSFVGFAALAARACVGGGKTTLVGQEDAIDPFLKGSFFPERAIQGRDLSTTFSPFPGASPLLFLRRSASHAKDAHTERKLCIVTPTRRATRAAETTCLLLRVQTAN